jgi:hypothetical protein
VRRVAPLPLLLLAACPSGPPDPLPPAPWDRDGDGVDELSDCDDRDPATFPGAPEACDGVDQDCDGSTAGEEDGDGDGHRACADCDDARADVFPGAPATCDDADSDCDNTVDEAEAASPGEHPLCPALDCAAVEGVDAAWIDAGGDVAFRVDCDGPWVVLALDSSDGLLVASNSAANGWDKCDDDGAAFWPWVDEGDVVPDSAPEASHTLLHDAAYVGPGEGGRIEGGPLRALSAHVQELHPDDRLVAVVADDDGGDWQGGGGSGLEAYAVGADGTWFLLSPGSGGDCGGGPGSWPRPGSESGFYLWSSDAWASEALGDTGLSEPLGALPAGATLPVRFVLAVHTGGGVAVGWTGPTFRVR